MNDMNTKETLRTVAEQWMTEVWKNRQIESVDRLHAQTFTDRSPAGRDTDNQAYKVGLKVLFEAFPDFHAETEDLIVDAEAGKVAIRWTADGTHWRPFMGYSPTGHEIRFRGIEILRIEGGLIHERWGEWDESDLIRQLSREEQTPADEVRISTE